MKLDYALKKAENLKRYFRGRKRGGDKKPDARMRASALTVAGLTAVSFFLCVWAAGSTLLNQRVFPQGTTVNGFDIGGLSYRHGLAVVLNQNRTAIENMEVQLVHYGSFISLDAEELGIVVCIEDLLSEACYSDTGTTLESSVSAVMSPKEGKAIDISPLFDERRIQNTLQKALSESEVQSESPLPSAVRNVFFLKQPVLQVRRQAGASGEVALNVDTGVLMQYAEGQPDSEQMRDVIKSIDNSQVVPYRETIEKYAKMYDLDPAFVTATAFSESSFRKTIRSSAGAIGVMQIMPLTGLWIAGKIGITDYTVEMLLDPDVNIHMGCWYISYLMEKFHRNEKTVSAAYYAGPARVEAWLADKQYSRDGRNLDVIPFERTRSFVERMAIYYQIYINVFMEIEQEDKEAAGGS